MAPTIEPVGRSVGARLIAPLGPGCYDVAVRGGAVRERADSGARLKHGMRDVYDRAAERYERYIMPTFAPIARRVVELARPRAVDRYLDLATGTGLVPRVLARQEAVVGVDLSGSMLRRARLGVATLRPIQGDLERLPLRAGVVDVVTLALALHHLPAPHAALAEARRALRPGGRLALAAWAREMSPLWQAFDRWFEAAGLGESRAAQQSQRAIDTPEALRGALEEAGFRACDVTSGRVPIAFPDLASFWEWRTSFPATHRALTRRSEREGARRRADCLAALAPLAPTGPARADQDVMFAVATTDPTP